MNLLQFPIWSKKIQKFHEVPKKPKGNGCWREVTVAECGHLI